MTYRYLCWAAAAIALSTMGMFGQGLADGHGKKWDPYITLGGDYGNDYSIGYARLFAPVYQNERSLLFTDLRGTLFSRGRYEGNIGLAYRHQYRNMILGGYGFFDIQNSENDNRFYQATVGGEALWEAFGVRVNGYIPVGDDYKDVPSHARVDLLTEGSGASATQKLIFTDGGERALYGAQGDVGLRLWDNTNSEIRVWGGGFYYTADRVKNIAGPSGRLEWRLFDFWRPGSRLTVGGFVRNDDVRDTDWNVGARIRLPFGSGRRMALSGLDRRMVETIYRDDDIVTSVGAIGPSGPAVDAVTGSEFSKIVTASTLAELTAAVAESSNKVVVVDANALTLAANLGLQAGQTLTGAGVGVRVQRKGGSQTSTFTPVRKTATATPTLTAGAGGAMITMAANSHVAGLTLDAGDQAATNGITMSVDGTAAAPISAAITDVTIRNVNANAHAALVSSDYLTMEVKDLTVKDTDGSEVAGAGFHWTGTHGRLTMTNPEIRSTNAAVFVTAGAGSVEADNQVAVHGGLIKSTAVDEEAFDISNRSKAVLYNVAIETNDDGLNVDDKNTMVTMYGGSIKVGRPDNTKFPDAVDASAGAQVTLHNVAIETEGDGIDANEKSTDGTTPSRIVMHGGSIKTTSDAPQANQFVNSVTASEGGEVTVNNVDIVFTSSVGHPRDSAFLIDGTDSKITVNGGSVRSTGGDVFWMEFQEPNEGQVTRNTRLTVNGLTVTGPISAGKYVFNFDPQLQLESTTLAGGNNRLVNVGATTRCNTPAARTAGSIDGSIAFGDVIIGMGEGQACAATGG